MFLNESWLDLVGRFDPSYSILGISRERFGLWKIQIHRSIELIELHMEPGWNTWNMFLNDYEKVSVGRFDRSRWFSEKFLGTLRAMENSKLPFDRAH
jgi:hypothetical protein